MLPKDPARALTVLGGMALPPLPPHGPPIRGASLRRGHPPEVLPGRRVSGPDGVLFVGRNPRRSPVRRSTRKEKRAQDPGHGEKSRATSMTWARRSRPAGTRPEAIMINDPRNVARQPVPSWPRRISRCSWPLPRPRRWILRASAADAKLAEVCTLECVRLRQGR